MNWLKTKKLIKRYRNIWGLLAGESIHGYFFCFTFNNTESTTTLELQREHAGILTLTARSGLVFSEYSYSYSPNGTTLLRSGHERRSIDPLVLELLEMLIVPAEVLYNQKIQIREKVHTENLNHLELLHKAQLRPLISENADSVIAEMLNE